VTEEATSRTPNHSLIAVLYSRSHHGRQRLTIAPSPES
jgi:hypothetical protein